MKTTMELTYSQVMALQSILAEVFACPIQHSRVYIDVVNDRETTVEGLIVLFSNKMHDGPWTRER